MKNFSCQLLIFTASYKNVVFVVVAAVVVVAVVVVVIVDGSVFHLIPFMTA